MKLNGTRFQGHVWEQVCNLLEELSVRVLVESDSWDALLAANDDPEHVERERYIDAMLDALGPMYKRSRGQVQANQYGDTVVELALDLVLALREPGRAKHFRSFVKAFCSSHRKTGRFWETAQRDAFLRTLFNHLYADVKDAVDRDAYIAATGRVCPQDYMRICRAIDCIYREVEAVFAKRSDLALIGKILGREVAVTPIEVSRLKSRRDCRPEWLLNYSAAVRGPLHSKANWIATYRKNPDKISEILHELDGGEDAARVHEVGDEADGSQDGPVESGNRRPDTSWLDDLVKVGRAVEAEDSDARDETSDEPPVDEPDDEEAPEIDASAIVNTCLSREPRVVQLAIYLDKFRGMSDATYPDDLIATDTGMPLSMRDLAKKHQVSEPTFRKLRKEAAARFDQCIRAAISDPKSI